MTARTHLILIAGTILLVCAVLMLMPIDEVSGDDPKTIFVDDDAGGGGNGSSDNPLNKIQDAVNGSSPGDRVYVLNGTYKENVVITHSLVLEGENRDEVKVEGAGGLDVINVKGISGVTITNFTLNRSNRDDGSGIGLEHSDRILVTNVSVTECFYGFLLYNSNDSVLTNIEAVDCSVGMTVTSYSKDIIISDAIFQLNKIYGILVELTLNFRLENLIVRDNGDDGVYIKDIVQGRLVGVTSEKHPGNAGIRIIRGNYTLVYNCTTKENRYGIIIGESTGCVVESCTSQSNDRGVTLEHTNSTTIIYSNFRDNTAVGIYVYLSEDTYIYENLIELNDVGIKVHYSSNTEIPVNNTFNSNTYLNVFPQINTPPLAHIKADNTTVGKNQAIAFDASASHDNDTDTPIVAYKVDFGDGNITDWVNYTQFIHSYDDYGNYTVRLYVRDSVGNVSENPDNIVYINVKKEKDTVVPFYVYGLMLMVGILSVGVLYLGIRVQQLKQVDITEAFLIYGESGSLMCHARALPAGGTPGEGGAGGDAEGGVEGIGGAEGLDADVTIAMLSAIQDFIGDTFGRGDDSGIGRLEYGESTIFIEKGKYVNLAVVANKSDNLIKEFLKKTVNDVESKHKDDLVQWNGDVSDMEKTKLELNELMKRKSSPVIIKTILSGLMGGSKDKPQLPEAPEEAPPDVDVKPEPVEEKPPVVEERPPVIKEEPVAMEPRPAATNEEPIAMEPQPADAQPEAEYMEPLDPSN